jgi:hypothetical protein
MLITREAERRGPMIKWGGWGGGGVTNLFHFNLKAIFKKILNLAILSSKTWLSLSRAGNSHESKHILKVCSTRRHALQVNGRLDHVSKKIIY